MNQIKIMDCTLRDGGWVNGFDFGRETMRDILVSDQFAGAEFVELGYLDQSKGSYHDKSMYANINALEESFENVRKNDITTRMVMIDFGKFDGDKLPKVKDRDASIIDGIRVCFHKKNMREAVEFGKQILSKGYKLFIQPMVISRYSEDDLKEMIEMLQKELPEFSAFYIVDSFGTMEESEICEKLSIADEYLDPEIMLGLHTHNNLNLCLDNSIAACRMIHQEDDSLSLKRKLHKDRILILDCTLDGLGKGPGNLVLEEIIEYLNENEGKSYDIDRFRELSERRIKPLRDLYSWGYAPEYKLCSRYKATSTYAKVFCHEKKKSLKDLETFLKNMSDNKKDSFDRKYLEEYIKKNNL